MIYFIIYTYICFGRWNLWVLMDGVVQVALETYLQTLINLPVKNKDEVIAFFCSDIVRETKKPVHQAGYKEGYLTKRGKNFGGWKTRYFVLQGPVLEYFESVGCVLIQLTFVRA